MDGRFVPWKDATLHVSNHCFLYGTGVFEGVRAYWDPKGKKLNVWGLPQHMDRLERNWKTLALEDGPSSKVLQEATTELLARNGYEEDVYIRPVVFMGQETAKVRPTELKARCVIFTFPLRNYFGRETLRAMVSSWVRPGANVIPPNGKINGAYANSYLATLEAQRAGYDEALMLNGRGMVSEAPGANFFMVKNGALITTPVTADILDGVTRAFIMRLAEDIGMKVHERDVSRVELYGADELFLSGTAVELMPITEVEGRKIGTGAMGAFTAKIKKGFQKAVRGEDAKYRDMLTPVAAAKRVTVRAR